MLVFAGFDQPGITGGCLPDYRFVTLRAGLDRTDFSGVGGADGLKGTRPKTVTLRLLY
jgi:hypothetical protein